MNSIKPLFLLGVLWLSFSPAVAQNTAPQGISYQAIARNSGGAVLANQNISLRFTIHGTTPAGTVEYSETQQVTTNPVGLFSLFIGRGTSAGAAFINVPWNSTSKYLQVEMDAAGGTSYTDMGTQQMMSVPFSMYADQAYSSKYANLAANAPQGAVNYQTSYYNINHWDSTSTISNNPAAGKINIKGTVTLSNNVTLSDSRYSLQIETQKPVLLPRMTQSMINALTPVEGMTVFNTDAHKMQVYALLTNNAEILNEIFAGTDNGPAPFIAQNFTPNVSGQVYAVDVMFKDAIAGAFPNISFFGNGVTTTSQSFNISGSYTNFTWYTFILTTPFTVNTGTPASFQLNGPGVNDRRFATNSYYPNGSGCCFPGADDLLFRIHIQPTPNSYGWQNLN